MFIEFWVKFSETTYDFRRFGGTVWNTRPYFWVVTCKNHYFHQKENLNYRHHILLAETDFYASLPTLPDQIKVRCDSCGKEYSYTRNEMLRAEVDIPDSFTPHPLFPSADLT
jgi:hypothetical protein